MAPEAAKAMAQCLTIDGVFANPASLQHGFGEIADALVKQSRTVIAHLLSCKAKDLIFTSGATESNNLALKGIALRYQSKGNHIITSASEHKAVLDTCKYLESIGFKITYQRPDYEGRISHDRILDALTEETILVPLMLVNNETGFLQDIDQIAQALKPSKIKTCFSMLMPLKALVS